MARPEKGVVRFHGTSPSTPLALLEGAQLRPDIALARTIDGPPGFYLSDDLGSAMFFAARRIAGQAGGSCYRPLPSYCSTGSARPGVSR
jgi:hypothetical protein